MELLVVITIIGILIALLLPAVQSAREAARRLACANNFKQVGVAMHNYHSTHGCFPPGSILWRGDTNPKCGPDPAQPAMYVGWGWGAFLLPYLEQQAVYDAFDFSANTSIYHPVNFPATAHRIGAYLCPSDPQGGELVFFTNYGHNGPLDEEDCRQTNMAGIADSRDWTCNNWYPTHFTKADGVMAERKGCRIADITDGTSNTLVIGEVTGAGRGLHQGFAWIVLDQIDTYDGVNSYHTVPGGGQWDPVFGGTGIRPMGPSSFHPGGCHFTMADGSVQFLSENITQNVLAALTTRADGEPISGGQF